MQKPKAEQAILVDHGFSYIPIPRIITGCWQLGGGHGDVDREKAIADLIATREADIDVFDCADHYVGVEELLGEFLRALLKKHDNPDLVRRTRIHTKCVPDIEALPDLKKAYVEGIIDRSLQRLGVERLDLTQFHWWDYDIPGYVEAANWLAELQKEGKIRYLGVTNFDVPHLREIVESGVQIVSNQTQYSLLDQRPESGMVEFCQRNDIKLLCYGSVAGGFLSEKYLGVPEPSEPLENRSLTKYKLIIDEFGGWELFQGLLVALSLIAKKHGVSITNVATRWVLDRPQVASVIVGARNASHLEDNLRVFQFSLEEVDRRAIQSVLQEAKGPEGDTYALERVKGGKHASIMRYNQNKIA